MDYIKRTSIKLKHQVTKNPFERLISDATNDDIQFPSNEILLSIADQSLSYNEYLTLMKHIWKRISPEEKNWIKILKTLNLMEFLLYFGNSRCLIDFREEKKRLRYTSQFEYMEKGVNRGLIVREKSNYVLDLLENNEKLEKSKNEMQNMKNKVQYRSGSESYGETKKKGIIENLKDKIKLDKVAANIKGVGSYVESMFTNIVSKDKKKDEVLHLDEFQDIGTYDDYFSQSKQENANNNVSKERTYELDREIESLSIVEKEQYETVNEKKKSSDFIVPEKENLFPIQPIASPSQATNGKRNTFEAKPTKSSSHDLLEFEGDKKAVLLEKPIQPELI